MIKLQADSSLIERTAIALGKQSISPPKVRKCYSSDSLVLRSIITDFTLKNIEIEVPLKVRPTLVMSSAQDNESPQKRSDELHQIMICPTSPPSVFQPPLTPYQASLGLESPSLSPGEKARD